MANIHDFLKENKKRVQREHRKEWVKQNILTLLSLFIAFCALVVSIFALVLPRGCECSDLDADKNTQYAYQDDVENVCGDSQ